MFKVTFQTKLLELNLRVCRQFTERGRESSVQTVTQPRVTSDLFPSLMPLSAVVPSLLTNRCRLLSAKVRNTGSELRKPKEASMFRY